MFSIFLEDWEGDGMNRLFSCGFGGYGRLGHNCADDEFLAREITLLSGNKGNPQRQVN